MRIDLDGVTLRRPRPDDAADLARLANDRNVWRNMRDAFPHPYTLEHAHGFIARNGVDQPVGSGCVLALEVEGRFAGACGLHPKSDVYARTAEVGYWLGAPFQGRGLATKAVGALVGLAFAQGPWVRLEAGVFSWNEASARVLEKNGFVRESVQRQSVFKDGQLIDAALYVKLKAP